MSLRLECEAAATYTQFSSVPGLRVFISSHQGVGSRTWLPGAAAVNCRNKCTTVYSIGLTAATPRLSQITTAMKNKIVRTEHMEYILHIVERHKGSVHVASGCCLPMSSEVMNGKLQNVHK